MKNIIYVAELDQDVDDIIAAEYLHRLGMLKEIVTDPVPTTTEGKARLEALRQKGIKTSCAIPKDAEIVFIGGALTTVAKFIKKNHLKTLVMNGGFVGSNIVPPESQLSKFKGKKFVRTFNFNIDINSTDAVLKSENIDNIILVGKNVCHNKLNTKLGFWKSGIVKDILDEYHVNDTKLQHDVLACHEGLAILGLIDEAPLCVYKTVYPINQSGLNGNMTQWGSSETKGKSPYRAVTSAITFVR